MKINFIIIFIFISLISIILSQLQPNPKGFKKNEKVTVNAGESVAFESESFKEGDKIYFKVTSAEFDTNNLYFVFYDEYDNDGAPQIDAANTFILSASKTKDAQEVYDSADWIGEGTTKYYVIKKVKKYLKNNIEGKYLGITPDTNYMYLIENYGPGDYTIVIVIVVIIVVVIVVGFLIFYCIKRKKRLAQMNNMNVYNGNNANVNNYPNQGNYGPQTYNQNQNYNNNMNTNMNMNMNQVPPQGPPGAYGNNNNMGYNNVPYTSNPQQYSGIPQNSNPMRYG